MTHVPHITLGKPAPVYRCHKLVRALKIRSVFPLPNPDTTGQSGADSYGATIVPMGPELAPFNVDGSYHSKHNPQPGGYFVMYEDGYTSYSPAEAFEKGYTQEPAHPLDRIARVCHEVNRAYCQALGDDSQPAWEDAPEWQRASARMGVDLHLSGDFGPEASHLSWMRQKLDEGWTYGPVKDPAAKQHPCMVPFAELPREQQAKDFIFRAVVHALRQTV